MANIPAARRQPTHHSSVRIHHFRRAWRRTEEWDPSAG
jgi:hypothetical protein